MAPQRVQDSKPDSSAREKMGGIADRGGVVKARRSIGASMIREGSGLKDVVAASAIAEGANANGNGQSTGSEGSGVCSREALMRLSTALPVYAISIHGAKQSLVFNRSTGLPSRPPLFTPTVMPTASTVRPLFIPPTINTCLQ